MNYSLVFYPLANQEIIESIRWYNFEKENLGFEFYEELNAQLSLLAKNPRHYSIRFKNIRTSRIKRFPYLIYFRTNEKDTTLTILGVLHTSRNPQTIKRRN